jgi:hypothetical protein
MIFLFFKPKLKPTALLYLEFMTSRASLRRSKQDPPFHKQNWCEKKKEILQSINQPLVNLTPKQQNENHKPDYSLYTESDKETLKLLSCSFDSSTKNPKTLSKKDHPLPHSLIYVVDMKNQKHNNGFLPSNFRLKVQTLGKWLQKFSLKIFFQQTRRVLAAVDTIPQPPSTVFSHCFIEKTQTLHTKGLGRKGGREEGRSGVGATFSFSHSQEIFVNFYWFFVLFPPGECDFVLVMATLE